MNKSNAPWILAIITLVMLPFQIFCIATCSYACVTVGAIGAGAATESVGLAAALFVLFLVVPPLLTLLCGIFGFFGKLPSSRTFGKINLWLSILLILLSIVPFSAYGLAAGFCSLFGGISAIKNAKRA